LGSEELVASVLHDLENSPLCDKERALLRLVEKVNHQSSAISPEDMRPLYEGGWTDEAIYSAITVCALFNFYNRWIDATGVHPMTDEAHKRFGHGTAHNGYIHR
jgi:alkylhydroperoxidase family enzyme